MLEFQIIIIFEAQAMNDWASFVINKNYNFYIFIKTIFF